MKRTLTSLLFVAATNLADIKRILLATLPVWLLAAATLQSAEPSPRTNVLLIVADDLDNDPLRTGMSARWVKQIPKR